MATPSHSRKPSSRAALPRRTTKGPLDAPEDPLALLQTPTASSQQSSTPGTPRKELNEPNLRTRSSRQPSPSVSLEQERPVEPPETQTEERDLSFLLDSSIYHALSQVEVPGPFRKPFLPPPTPETPSASSLLQLDTLLSQCDFLRAAQLAGSVLVSGTVAPTDARTIFRLLEIRYSCLELSGNLLMAAQEAKALEDLSSDFYYDHPAPEKESGDEETEARPRRLAHHMMPFSLRLQVLRLQSIGFSDPRRGVSSLYDVAMECREYLSAAKATPEQRTLWARRLQEVSIRVVNALIENGDLDAAARTLESLKPLEDEALTLWTSRLILLKVKMGDVSGVEKLIKSSTIHLKDQPVLQSLFATAQGRLEEAVEILSEASGNLDPASEGLLKQNLAVAYLYRGDILKARQILADLVDGHHSFQTLTVNLATIYDLTSDRSRDLKSAMASRIAQQDKTQIRSFMNADFKL